MLAATHPFLILAVPAHPTTIVNQGIFSGVFGQVVAGVLVLLVGAIGTFMVKSIRSLVHTVDGTVEKVDEVHDAVAGRKPSDLVPFPAPGLVQVVANHTKQLTKQGGQINDIQAMVQKLTAEPPLTKSDISTVAETVVAGVAEGVAARQTEVIDAVHERDEGLTTHDRREDDSKDS